MHLRLFLSVSLLVLVIVGFGQTHAAVQGNASATTSISVPTQTISTSAISGMVRTVAIAADTIDMVHNHQEGVEAARPAVAAKPEPDRTAPMRRISTVAAATVPEATDVAEATRRIPAVAAVVVPEATDVAEATAEMAVSSQADAATAPVDSVDVQIAAPTILEEAPSVAEAVPDVAVSASQAVPVAQEIAAFEKPVSGALALPNDAVAEPIEPAAQVSGDPVRIVAPSIGLDEPVISVGLDEYNVPIVPNHDPGWYNLSARPGKGENVVFWGHVLRFQYAPEIPAPFGRVKELAPGAPITVYTADGLAYTYVVDRQVWVEPHQVEYILPQGSEQLTLVSCIGEYIIVDGSVENMSHRLITIAVPAL